MEEADRLAEIERQKWLAQQEQWRRNDDRRQVEKSVHDSREALGDVITRWSRVVEVERFFQGVEDRAGALADEERVVVLERLALAREFLGSNDPLDFFRAWRTPRERYRPLYET